MQLKNTCLKCSALLLTPLKAGGIQEVFPHTGSNRKINLLDGAHGFARKIRLFFFSLLRSQCCPEKRGFSSVKSSSLAPLWFCCRSAGGCRFKPGQLALVPRWAVSLQQHQGSSGSDGLLKKCLVSVGRILAELYVISFVNRADTPFLK